MSEELKPCPFCGGGARLQMEFMSDGYEYKAVVCSKCGATMPGNFSINGDQAEWDWNSRAIDRDALLDLADDLEEPWKLEDGFDTAEELRCGIEEYERAVAELIRKAVGA